MRPKDARSELNAIRQNYLCPVCRIPAAFCREHSEAEREYPLTALKDTARRKTKRRRSRRKLPKQ